MSKEENNVLNTGQLTCYWCQSSMRVFNSFEKTVCINCYRKLSAAGLREKEIFNHEFSIFSTISKKDSDLESSIKSEIEEIENNYIIPFEIKPILRNILAVKIDVENSFSEAEKEVLPYIKIKSSIDAQIAKILKLCEKK